MNRKWEDRRDLIFSPLCLVGKIEKWDARKLICLVGNEFGINLQLYPY